MSLRPLGLLKTVRVTEVLKVSGDELLGLPNDLKKENTVAKLNQRYNKNVLIMDDLNDNLHNQSVLNYLHRTFDKNRLFDWKEIFECPF